MMRALLVTALIAAIPIVSACDSPAMVPSLDTRIANATRPGDAGGGGGGDAPLTLAAESVYTMGVITEVPSRMGRGTFLIEEHPDRSWGAGAGPFETGEKYYVTVTAHTAIRIRSATGEGRQGRFEEIAPGMHAEVWFTGPIRESFPAQGTAARIAVLQQDR